MAALEIHDHFVLYYLPRLLAFFGRLLATIFSRICSDTVLASKEQSTANTCRIWQNNSSSLC